MTTNTNIRESLEAAKVLAMKAGDKARLTAIRSFLESIVNQEKAGKTQTTLNDEQITKLGRKMVASRRESAKIYTDAGSEDRAEAFNLEAEIIESFLPEQVILSDAEIESRVDAVIRDLTEKGNASMGAVMGALKKVDHMDMKRASAMVKAKL